MRAIRHIETYSHHGKIGVLVEVEVEDDFIPRTKEFRALALDLALQVAARRPVSVEDLLGQAFIRDESTSVGDVIKRAEHEFHSYIAIKRFICFSSEDEI